jgi:hypothetical protein
MMKYSETSLENGKQGMYVPVTPVQQERKRKGTQTSTLPYNSTFHP